MKKLLLSILMVLMAVPAFAVNVYNTPEGDKVDLYGSIRMAAAYQNSQGFNGGSWAGIKSDLDYSMFATSRFGMLFNVGKLFGNVEFNFNMDGSGATSLGFRQLYAGYNFDNGHKLTFGQKTILTGSSQYFSDYFFGDNSFAGFGVLSSVRRPTIVYSYYGLDIGFVVNTDAVGKAFTSKPAGPENTPPAVVYTPAESYIPRFEIAYNFKATNFSGKVGGTYGLFTEKNAGKYKNIDAFHFVVVVQPKFGAGYLTATAFYGMNNALYATDKAVQIGGGGIGVTDVMPQIIDGKVINVQSAGVAVEGGYNFNDFSGIILGAGFQGNMSKRYYKTSTGVRDGRYHDLLSYGVYVQAPFKLNKYMKIIPAVGYFNSFYSNTTKASKRETGTLLAGAEFKVDF